MASVASDSDHRTLTVANAGAAVRVTLARPEKRNALSLELMSELIGVLQAIGERSDIRAIVIEGSGVAFSAGQVADRQPEQCVALQRREGDSRSCVVP